MCWGGEEHSIKFIDMVDFIKNKNIEKYIYDQENNYITFETYFRLFISDLFPQYDKVIYLDADILVLDDLQSLYNNDIDDYYIGAVCDKTIEKIRTQTDYIENHPEHITYNQYFNEKLNLKNYKYFNAGVLLFNLKKIRECNITEKLWDFVVRINPLIYQDQDVLNALMKGKVKYIENKYNYNYNYFQENNKEELPVIIHYVGPYKPWNESIENIFYLKYWDYAEKSSYWNNELKEKAKEYKALIFQLKIFNFIILKLLVRKKHYIRVKFLFISFKIKIYSK